MTNKFKSKLTTAHKINELDRSKEGLLEDGGLGRGWGYGENGKRLQLFSVLILILGIPLVGQRNICFLLFFRETISP